MKYAKHRSSFGKQPASGKRKIISVAIIFVGIIFILYAAFGVKKNVEEVVQTDSGDVVIEILNNSVGDVKGSDDYEQAELFAVGKFEGSGIARRGVGDNLFTHVVVADLPEIDTSTHFYEGWLVKPGIIQFFSTGEMCYRDDGKWGLVWEVDLDDASSDLFDYSKVVVTLEEKDENPAPSVDHVIEGEF